uniref:Uncharacterized protein n=1 Tax=Sphaerodactylus townsendi TaxID=933632 RepID=A0ACB8GCH2_9SAUR
MPLATPLAQLRPIDAQQKAQPETSFRKRGGGAGGHPHFQGRPFLQQLVRWEESGRQLSARVRYPSEARSCQVGINLPPASVSDELRFLAP